MRYWCLLGRFYLMQSTVLSNLKRTHSTYHANWCWIGLLRILQSLKVNTAVTEGQCWIGLLRIRTQGECKGAPSKSAWEAVALLSVATLLHVLAARTPQGASSTSFFLFYFLDVFLFLFVSLAHATRCLLHLLAACITLNVFINLAWHPILWLRARHT